MPGQCAMLSIPGVGEAMFSITSSPTNHEFMEFSIKKCGCLTTWLHQMDVGQQITIRGLPWQALPGRDRTQGSGSAVHRRWYRPCASASVINYVRDNRENYGKINIVYGSRSKDDLVDYPEITNEWCKEAGINVHLTIDRPQEGWDGHVGFVPNYVTELGFDPQGKVLVCGPPIMIKFVLQGLDKLGFDRTQVFTTLEMRMKCGIGKCGRCNVGNKYVCKDGPVFRFDEMGELPDEY